MVFSRVLLNRSTWAFAAGHRGVILQCLMLNCLHHAVNSSDPKGTLSDVMTSGIPCVANIWVRCVMAVAAELEWVTWTSGYFWCFINSDKKILSGWKWATVINMDGVPYLFWFICHSEGLWGRCGPTIWQPRHSCTYLSALIIMPGHQTLCLRCCLTLVMPWWPSCANCRMRVCIRDNNTIVSQINPTFLAKFIL